MDEVDDRYAGIDIDSLLNRNDTGRSVYLGRKKALYEAPEFLQRLNGEETLLEGQALCLECKVCGFPVPTLRWYKDDEEIIEHPRIKVESDGRGGYALKIDNVMRGDEAAYRCRAENVEGACSSVFFLSVRAKPKSPKKDSQKSPNRRTVSFPPMFSTIVEKVEEEEKQGKEFEMLPPSPLTDSYYALTLKSRATWPAFLGDWAFKNGGRRGSDTVFVPNGDSPEPLSPSEGRKNARRSLTRSDLTARVEAKKQRLEEEKKQKEEKEKETATKMEEEEKKAAKKRKEEEDIEARKLETKLIMQREERRRKRVELESESAQKEEAMRKRREARAERLEREKKEREDEKAKLKKEKMEEEKIAREKLEFEKKQAEDNLKRLQEDELKQELFLKEKRENEEKERKLIEQKRRKEENLKENEEQTKRNFKKVGKELEEKIDPERACFKKEDQKEKLHSSIGLFEKREIKSKEKPSLSRNNQELKAKDNNDILCNPGADADHQLKSKPKALSMFESKTETKTLPLAALKPQSNLTKSTQESTEFKQPKSSVTEKPEKIKQMAVLNKSVQEKSGLFKANIKEKVASSSNSNDLSEPQVNNIPEKPVLKKAFWQKPSTEQTIIKVGDSAQENKIKAAGISSQSLIENVKSKEKKFKNTFPEENSSSQEPNVKDKISSREFKKRAEHKHQEAIKEIETMKTKGIETENIKKNINSQTAESSQEVKNQTKKIGEHQKKQEGLQKEEFLKQEVQRQLLAERRIEKETKEMEQKEREKQEKMRMQFRKEQLRKEQLKRQQEEEIKRKQQKENEELIRKRNKELTVCTQPCTKQEPLVVDCEEDFQVKVYKRDYSFTDLRKSLEMTLTEGGMSVMNVNEHKYWDDILVKHDYSIGDIKKTFDTLSTGSATLDRPTRLRSRRNSIEELERIQLKRSSSISDLRESYTKSLERPKYKKGTTTKETVQKDGEILKRAANVNETRQQLLETVKKKLVPVTSESTTKEADITIRNLKTKTEKHCVPSTSSPKPLAATGFTCLSNLKSKRASIHEMMLQQTEVPAPLRLATSSSKDLSKRKSYHGHDAYGSLEIPVYKRAAGWTDNIGKPPESVSLQTNTADVTKNDSSLDSGGKLGALSSSKAERLTISDKRDTSARPFVFNSTRTIARRFKPES